MDENVSQGVFHVKRQDDGRIRIECPPIMLVPPGIAVQMAQAMLQQARVEVIFANPGQTVIRPPRSWPAQTGKGNGR